MGEWCNQELIPTCGNTERMSGTFICPFPENLNVRQEGKCISVSGTRGKTNDTRIMKILYYTFSNKIMINIKNIFMFEHFILRTRSKQELDFEDLKFLCDARYHLLKCKAQQLMGPTNPWNFAIHTKTYQHVAGWLGHPGRAQRSEGSSWPTPPAWRAACRLPDRCLWQGRWAEGGRFTW